MGRQVFFFLLVCCVWAYLSRDIQGEFLGIWLELRAASKVTAADYDATWGRFILPRIALFTLTLVPVIIAFSFRSQTKRKSGKRVLEITSGWVIGWVNCRVTQFSRYNSVI